MTFIDKSPLQYNVNATESLRRFKDDRDPTTADYKQFKEGDMWLNSSSYRWWICAKKDGSSAIWEQFASIVTLEQVTPDTGGAVAPDLTGNFNLLGDSGSYLYGIQFIGDPANNTVSAIDLRNNTIYVVDSTAGETEYTTIQSALDAANAAGGGQVFVRQGTFVEDLTFYANISLKGTGILTVINGTHSLPSTGTVTVDSCFLISATDVFNSALAGTGILAISETVIGVTNGYTFNMPNWAGIIAYTNCIESITSVNNGLINCTGNTRFIIASTTGGTGTGNIATFSNGSIEMFGTSVMAPFSIGGTCTAVINGGSDLYSITTADTATVSIVDTKIDSGTSQAIIHDSSNTLDLSTVTIDSTNATPVDGTGTIKINGVSFLNNDVIAVTLTIDEDTYTHTGEIVAYNIERQKFTGFTAWDGAGPYYSVTGTDLTIEQSGYGYIKGRKVTWAASQSTGSLSQGAAYLLYIDEDGIIGTTTSFSQATYENYIPLFEVLVDNAGTPNVLVVKENHPYSSPTDLSVYLHNTVGTVISNRNNGANINLNGTDGIEIVGEDYLEDHGLETIIPDSGSVAETFNFFYTDAGGKWVLYSSTATFPSVYNNSGVVTALPAGKFGVFSLFVSKDDLNSTIPKYFAVMDDSEYNNATNIRAAIVAGTVAQATNELFALEMCLLGYVIYEQSTSSIIDVIIQKATIRGNVVSNTASTANLISTNTANFNGWLSASDTTVQAALDTLDDVGLGVTPQHSVLLADASFGITSTGVLTDGQLVIGNTGNAPSVATLTSTGGTVNITNGAGTINLETSGGFNIVTTTTDSVAGAVNTMYIIKNATPANLTTITLPDTAAVGDTIQILGYTSGGFTIAQNAGEQIFFGNQSTTIGAGGSISSTLDHDCIELVCVTADTEWQVVDSVGNFTIV